MSAPKMTPEHQLALVSALREAFADSPFDASTNPELMAAIEQIVPNLRHKGGYFQGRVKPSKQSAVRHTLKALAEQYFTTDRFGWWRLKPTSVSHVAAAH